MTPSSGCPPASESEGRVVEDGVNGGDAVRLLGIVLGPIAKDEECRTMPHNINFQQSIDQSERLVPVNLRQSGDPGIQLLLSNRVRKSPYWHLSVEAGCWKATVYNRMYHPALRAPRGRWRHGGISRAGQRRHLVECRRRAADPRQARGRSLLQLCLHPRRDPSTNDDGRYVVLCDEQGRVLNDPVMLRVADDEFWFTISDSDLAYWFRGVNHGMRFDVEIDEIDVSPLQVQGPKSEDLLADLVGEAVREVPYYGLMAARIEGADVLISQTGFSGEKGYESMPTIRP